LQNKTNEISEVETPATKLNPALRPLLMLCLMIANMIGPTEMLKINPSTKPLISGAIIF
jgi:hypothetical protein